MTKMQPDLEDIKVVHFSHHLLEPKGSRGCQIRLQIVSPIILINRLIIITRTFHHEQKFAMTEIDYFHVLHAHVLKSLIIFNST